MKRNGIILLLLILPLLGAATTRPSTVVDPAGCVTSDCHANIKSAPVLHGPTANNSCEACHELADVAKHQFRMSRDGGELCTYCHEFDVSAMPVIHKPVSLGQCTGCHDPHGARDHTLTLENSMQELCYRCHDHAPSDHAVLHTPVRDGQCNSCHPPHAAMFPKLLDAVGSDLCLACHDQLDQKLAVVRVRHKAMEQGCEKCHDAHGSDEPMQLTQATTQLCEGCHDPIKQRIATATHRHSAATTGKACMTCHTPHGADAVGLLTDQPIRLCMGCHKDPIRIADGRTIPPVSELTSPGMHLHGAIKEGQCSGCHESHGTTEPMLLAKPYSTQIYQPFSIEQFELCFSCHDQRLVTSESTDTFTNFRNGERNLHWVHVKVGERGRACAMCHTTHASVNERNIRDTVPLRVWKMPIRFAKTETGGSCAPGCHQPWEYDRQQPVAGPTSRPSEDRDLPPAPRQLREPEPVLVRLNAHDTRGREAKIPTTRPTVIALVRDDSKQSQAVLTQIGQSIAGKEANVVVIVSGPDAAVCAQTVDREDWSIIADPDSRLASQLQIYGWPMAMVVQADGLKVSSFGGSVQSLGLKLGPYLDLATKTLDQAAIDRILKNPVVASDGEAGLATRNLQLAKKLLAENQPAEALRLLNEAQTRAPDSLPLKLETIRDLLALKRVDEASALIEKVPPDALPAGMQDVLRARVMLARYHWIDARILLTRTLEKYPDLAEAHYLLGTIYEQDGQWQKAAQEYRAAGGAILRW